MTIAVSVLKSITKNIVFNELKVINLPHPKNNDKTILNSKKYL